MGCDIHCYIEYTTWTDRNGDPYWDCMGGRYNPGRHYAFFGLMADCGRSDQDPVFPNRGVPEGKLSYEVERDLFLTINDEYKDEEGYCSTAQAEKWGPIEDVRGDGKYLRVKHPDWHSHSWLTADEFAQVIATYMTEYTEHPYDVGWDAILAAMRAFEERGARARLIFWFDN